MTQHASTTSRNFVSLLALAGLLASLLICGCDWFSSGSGSGSTATPTPPPVVTVTLPGTKCAGKVAISSIDATVDPSGESMTVKVCVTCNGAALGGVGGIKATLEADDLPSVVARVAQQTFPATDSVTGCTSIKVNLKLGASKLAAVQGKTVEVRVLDTAGSVVDKQPVTVK